MVSWDPFVFDKNKGSKNLKVNIQYTYILQSSIESQDHTTGIIKTEFETPTLPEFQVGGNLADDPQVCKNNH